MSFQSLRLLAEQLCLGRGLAWSSAYLVVSGCALRRAPCANGCALCAARISWCCQACMLAGSVRDDGPSGKEQVSA